MRRPKGVAALTAVVGAHAEVQTLALRCDSAGAAAALRNASTGEASANASWSLTLDHRTTAALPWGASAAEVKHALEGLRTVMHVDVVRSGDEASPAFHFGYVYTVRFWGSANQGPLGYVPKLLFHAGPQMSEYGSGVHAFVDVVREGAAHAASTGTYTALAEGTTYYGRVKAVNAEGWGPYSAAPLAVTTASGPLLPGAPTGVSLGSAGAAASSTSLSLRFSPPDLDGGGRISHYRVEWASDALFSPAKAYGSASLQVVHEVQQVSVDFRSGSDLATRGGTFVLAWGGKATRRLAWDVSAEALAVAVQGISGIEAVGENPVHVTRMSHRHGYRWDVTFSGRRGDVGEMVVDGTDLFGDDASASVTEKVKGVADIVPGAFTYEEQAVAVRASSKVSGHFRLSFEGKETANITFDESRESFKYKLEALKSISVAFVKRELVDKRLQLYVWTVRFAYLKHETLLGAGDVGLFLVPANHLEGNRARVDVVQNVKGTSPLQFSVSGLKAGTLYFARVSAQNAKGFGPASAVASAMPVGQPSEPTQATLAVAGGSSLKASWSPPVSDGGSALTNYAVEWYSAPGTPEVQVVTTSAEKGTIEVQTLEIGADTEGISGYFQLAFKGQRTDNIEWDAPATGAASVKAKLERLTTIGTVDVTRDYSRTVVAGLRVDVWEGSDNMTASATSTVKPSRAGLQRNDLLFVAGVAVRVRDISSDGSTVLFGRVKNFRTAKRFNEGQGARDVTVEKWANGYKWDITFTSHNGDQPNIVPYPSDSWGGSNPTLHVRETLAGLQPISGSFRLGFKGHRTGPIPCDASASDVEAALEGLHTLSDVTVSRHANGFGHNWLVTFASELGPQPLLVSHGAQLAGPGASVFAARETLGVLPADYCAQAASSGASNSATSGAGGHGKPLQLTSGRTSVEVGGLTTGKPYFVVVRASNGPAGFGRPASTQPARVAPVAAPGAPRDVTLLPLSDVSLKVVWAAPEDNGGLNVTNYRVEWDTSEGFGAIATSGYSADVSVTDPDAFACCGGLYYFNVPVTHASAWMPRFARVRAYNGFAWGDNGNVAGPIKASLRAPGLVQRPSLVATSGVGLLVAWEPPSAELAEYGGDGGSAVTEYLVEYDTSAAFDGPAIEVTVKAGGATELLLGGRVLMTGEESPALEPEVEYHVRVTAFNGVGYGPASVTSPAALVPTDQLPTQAHQVSARTVSARAIESSFGHPDRDGGVALTTYRVEYDLDGDAFGSVNGSTFEPRGGFIDVPVVRELQALELSASSVVSEEQWLIASVEVTNERQTVRTNVTGVDEVQMITVMADEVMDTVMTVTTTASDYNEEQSITIDATDLDEVQTLRTQVAAVLESQTLTVSATRRNEVQTVTITLEGDTSSGGAVTALASALGGSYQLKLDTRTCEWCDAQQARTTADIVSPFTAANLEAALELLPNVDDVDVTLATEVVTAASSGGVINLHFNVTFSGDGLRGDISSMEVASNLLTNTSKHVFVTDLQVSTPHEGAQPAGSFYLTYHCESRTTGVEVAATTGSSSFTLKNATNATVGDVVRVNVGTHQDRFGAQSRGASYEYFRVTGVAKNGPVDDGTVEVALDRSFSDAGGWFQGEIGVWYSNMSDAYGVSAACYGADPETTLRIDHNASADYLKEKLEALSTIPSGGGIEVVRVPIPAGNARRFGKDWDDVEVVGYDYNITFVRNHGDLHDLFCEIENANLGGGQHPFETTNPKLNNAAPPRGKQCSVSQWTDRPFTNGVFLDGTWTVSLPFPHFQQAYDKSNGEGGVRRNFTTAPLRFDASAAQVAKAMEDIYDARSGDRVFGTVGVTRAPYMPSADSKWSGQYLWVVTFLSRPGNVPPMLAGDAALFGNDGNGTRVAGRSVTLPANLTVGTGTRPLTVDAPGAESEGNEVTGTFGMDYTDPATGAVTTSNCSHFTPWLTGPDMAEQINSAFFTLGSLSGTVDPGSAKLRVDGYDNATNGVVLEVNHWLSPDGENFYTVLGFDSKTRTATLDRPVFLPGSPTSAVSLTRVAFGVDAVDVTREGPTQAMGYTWTVTFTNKTVGLDQPLLSSSCDERLNASGVELSFSEVQKGNQLAGSFALSYNGDITPALAYDSDAATVEAAMNALHSIFPSRVAVSRTSATTDDRTQVKGYTWSVTFTSSTWHDPTDHDSAAAFVDGNWQGPPVAYDAVWASTGAGRFSRAWGKNVGELHPIACNYEALSTARVDGSERCDVLEVSHGSNPLSGTFRVGLDTSEHLIMAKRGAFQSGPIAHNAFASAADTNGDGTSVEEILEAMPNIGDVEVSRVPVNLGGNSGGYSWLVTFIRDADAPCQEKDDESGLCNAPGNVPKFDRNLTDASALLGSRVSGGVRRLASDRGEVTLLDVHDKEETPRGVTEIQRIRTFDLAGLASDRFANNATFTVSFNGSETVCLPWNVSAAAMQAAILSATGAADDYTKDILVTRSERPVDDDLWGSGATPAPNGYVWSIFYRGYDGDVPDPETRRNGPHGNASAWGINLDGTKNSTRDHCRPFELFQRLDSETRVQGRTHVVNCTGYGCIDGVALRGNLTDFFVEGDDNGPRNRTGLHWNAQAAEVKHEVERRGNFSRTVEVSRRVVDKYGGMEWVVTFTSNPGMTPTGAGDVNRLIVVQENYPRGGLAMQPIVTETVKGSAPLEGYFTVDFADPLQAPRIVRYSETAERLERKLEEMGTIHDVSVLRAEWPSNVTGGWGELPTPDGTRGGFSWQVRFLRNPGTYGGATFPPGSGDVHGLAPTNTALSGEGAQVLMTVVAEGSKHLDGGSVRLTYTQDGYGSETTDGDLKFNLDASSVEAALEALPNLGAASVSKGLVTAVAVPGVLAYFPRDSDHAVLVGDTDLTRFVAPGEVIRFGGVANDAAASLKGSDGEITLNGASGVGHRGTVQRGSPLVATDEEHAGGESGLAPGRSLRLAGYPYEVTKTGAEVQQVVVGAPAASLVNGVLSGEFYQLRLTYNGAKNATTGCLRFNASAAEMQAALEGLINVGAGNVRVTRRGAGMFGDAFVYRIYFDGAYVRGDVPLVAVVRSADGDARCNGVDAASTGATVWSGPWVEGGKTEHQRLSLSVDSGRVEGKFFRLRYTASRRQASESGAVTGGSGGNGTVSTTGCLEWGASAADVEAALQALPALSERNLTLSHGLAVNTSGLEVFGSSKVHLSAGVTDGLIFVGDFVRIAGANSGSGSAKDLFLVTAVGAGSAGEGISLTLKPKVFAAPGQGSVSAALAKHVAGSVRVRREGFGRGAVEVQRLVVSANATVPATASGQRGLYRLRLDVPRSFASSKGEGDAANVVQHVSECLPYDASAALVQGAVNRMFIDFSDDGRHDYQDLDHVNVTREGDGTASSGYGYAYTFSFKGRPHYRGLSTALGPQHELQVVGVGSLGGCEDLRPSEEDVLSLTLDTSGSNGEPTAVPSKDARGILRPGDKVLVEGSVDPREVFTVAAINGANALTFSETFYCGSNCGSGKAVTLITDYGSPELWVDTVVEGAAQWAYDVFFTGPTLGDVEPLEVVSEGTHGCSQFDDWVRFCLASCLGARTCLFILCTVLKPPP